MTELPPAADTVAWIPEVRMCSEDDDLVVVLDLPGLREDDIAISVTRRVLVIRGTRVGVARPATAGEYAPASTGGHFCRRVAIPFTPRRPVRATLCDGMLEVRLPDARRVRREIPVTCPSPTPVRAP